MKIVSENQFSGKTYFYTIGSRPSRAGRAGGRQRLRGGAVPRRGAAVQVGQDVGEPGKDRPAKDAGGKLEKYDELRMWDWEHSLESLLSSSLTLKLY